MALVKNREEHKKLNFSLHQHSNGQL